MLYFNCNIIYAYTVGTTRNRTIKRKNCFSLMIFLGLIGNIYLGLIIFININLKVKI